MGRFTKTTNDHAAIRSKAGIGADPRIILREGNSLRTLTTQTSSGTSNKNKEERDERIDSSNSSKDNKSTNDEDQPELQLEHKKEEPSTKLKTYYHNQQPMLDEQGEKIVLGVVTANHKGKIVSHELSYMYPHNILRPSEYTFDEYYYN
ncbi:hypothetical protein ACA910_011560 [Epithemia clementina (nom. ined.)]